MESILYYFLLVKMNGYSDTITGNVYKVSAAHV